MAIPDSKPDRFAAWFEVPDEKTIPTRFQFPEPGLLVKLFNLSLKRRVDDVVDFIIVYIFLPGWIGLISRAKLFLPCFGISLKLP